MNEMIAERAARPSSFVLRLYIAGTTPRSMHAVKNLTELCDQYLTNRYELDVIDIYQQPNLAVSAQIIVTPTLVKENPQPCRLLVGTLENAPLVLQRLGISM